MTTLSFVTATKCIDIPIPLIYHNSSNVTIRLVLCKR